MPELQPHQQRVVAEKAELDERLNLLSRFVATDTFNRLDTPERVRLLHQHAFMRGYSEILAERIEAFTEASNG